MERKAVTVREWVQKKDQVSVNQLYKLGRFPHIAAAIACPLSCTH